MACWWLLVDEGERELVIIAGRLNASHPDRDLDQRDRLRVTLMTRSPLPLRPRGPRSQSELVLGWWNGS